MKGILEKAKVAGVIGATLLASRAFAADSQSQSITLCDPLGQGCNYGGETFASVANAVAGFLFWDIAVPLSTIMVLVGAFQMITSAGNPEKFSKGRKTLLYAAIGFAVAIIAGGVSNIIASFLKQ